MFLHTGGSEAILAITIGGRSSLWTLVAYHHPLFVFNFNLTQVKYLKFNGESGVEGTPWSSRLGRSYGLLPSHHCKWTSLQSTRCARCPSTSSIFSPSIYFTFTKQRNLHAACPIGQPPLHHRGRRVSSTRHGSQSLSSFRDAAIASAL